MATAQATSRVTSIPSAVTASVLAAADLGRVGFLIYNDSSADLYVKYGLEASTTDFTFKLAPGQTYEAPVAPNYVGVITGIWGAVNGAARVTELF